MTRPGPFAVEPPRERPDSPPPSYGVPRAGGDFVDWEHVVERLTTAEAFYEPEPDRWDQGSAWRIAPESVLAWRDMPTSTRWRFRRS